MDIQIYSSDQNFTRDSSKSHIKVTFEQASQRCSWHNQHHMFNVLLHLIYKVTKWYCSKHWYCLSLQHVDNPGSDTDDEADDDDDDDDSDECVVTLLH